MVCVASRSQDKANAFATKFNCQPVVGYERLVEVPELDVIYMPLPTALHDHWVHCCLDAGKHLIVEKSMAANLGSATSMVNQANENNLLLSENFMFQFHRQIEFIRELIQQNAIGEIRQFRSSFGFPPLPRENFRFNKSLGGGALLDAGAYTLKAAQLFLGTDLKVKSSSLVDTMSCGVDTLGAAHLTDLEGRSALVGFGFENFYQCNFEIWGTDGKINGFSSVHGQTGFFSRNHRRTSR